MEFEQLLKGEQFMGLPEPKASLPCAISGVTEKIAPFIAWCMMKKQNKKGIFVADSEADIEKITAAFSALFDGKGVLYLPEIDFVFETVDAVSQSVQNERGAVLEKMATGDFNVVVTTLDGLIMPCPEPSGFAASALTINVGQKMDIESLLGFLTDNGYAKFEMVEGKGSFSRRGEIVDIFSPNYQNPVRIDFFDDEIENIYFFDVITQRRIDTAKSITLISSTAALGKKADRVSLLSKLKEIYFKTQTSGLKKDIELLENGMNVAFDKYIPLIYPNLYTPLDYVADKLLFICEYRKLKKRYEFIKWQLDEDIKHFVEKGEYFAEGDYYLNQSGLEARMDKNTVLLSALGQDPQVPLSNLCEISAVEDALLLSDGESLPLELKSYIEQGYITVICARDSERLDKISKQLIECGLAVNTKPEVLKTAVNITVKEIELNLRFDSSKLLIISDSAPAKKKAKKGRYQPGEKIKSFSDINVGDLVVHVNHGIGVYRGIKKIENKGVIKDYIVIGYDKGDTLYVPCPQLDLISKYIGSADNKTIKLNRLGSPSWDRAKAKVRDQSKELAKELIELYARRLNAPGFAFSPDNEWMHEFEQRFEFDETDDQIRCINEIKSDMEKPYPMDRLLCGDVGFGKTEVALRAAFKAVNDSKQVALLAPTTILTIQHYNTIKERFKDFPVNIALINRFKTKAEQTKIINQLRRGEIDIIIGTHRLFQKDVAFKNLGLLIVDEEQRFGVKHKEKIKEMSIGVDVLTLSATPIPRTLNMALSGIRDMSIIEEAPADRHPVTTYVLEYNFDILLQAIRRELRRRGCVFYLKNDIESMEQISSRLHSALPEARIAIAHGQMGAVELENTWKDVIEHKVDILICTTIIETGVDISFANTLIIEDADCLGLSQLHQIRGRVGRSSTRAYAYLTYRRDRIPNEVAAKRLMTIKEFTEFGSGLKIAMRDLEIRGAGSLLGEKQHGSMNIVGYDMYMQILKDVILREQGKQPETKADCTIDISISAYIPESYITSERLRIDIYKKIAAIENEDDYADVIDELTDRFSPPPKPVKNLMKISLIRNLARGLSIYDIKQKAYNIVFYLSNTDEAVSKLLLQKYKSQLLYSYSDKPYYTLRLNEKESVCEQMLNFLQSMYGLVHSKN